MKRLDSITKSYRLRQRMRIEGQRKRIASARQLYAFGRTIPDPADLTIGKGRRLEASVLFLDICDFTSRAANTAQEQDSLVRILSLFFSEMIRVVCDYGGTVEKNTGDGIMAYFSRDPDRPGDVRHRALASALSMFYATTEFINPAIIATGLEPIAFRVCIDHGWITVARLGAAQRFNHIVAIGATANRTCKMLSHAGPNEILLGDSMLEGLPQSWRERFVMSKTFATGWSYDDGAAYGYWSYIGRWAEPRT